MEVNYFIGGAVLSVIIILLSLLLRKNSRDKKELEQKLNEPDLPPEKHHDIQQ